MWNDRGQRSTTRRFLAALWCYSRALKNDVRWSGYLHGRNLLQFFAVLGSIPQPAALILNEVLADKPCLMFHFAELLGGANSCGCFDVLSVSSQLSVDANLLFFFGVCLIDGIIQLYCCGGANSWGRSSCTCFFTLSHCDSSVYK